MPKQVENLAVRAEEGGKSPAAWGFGPSAPIF